MKISCSSLKGQPLLNKKNNNNNNNILYEQLHGYLSNASILSKCQFGFRRYHSTTTALLDSTNQWYSNMDKGLLNIVAFLDLKKAFDTIDHEILIEKLNMYGI